MTETNSRVANWMLVVLAAAILITSLYLYSRIQGVSGEVSELRATLEKETAALRKASEAAHDASAKQLQSLHQELQTARAEAVADVRQARGEARKHTASVAERLSGQEAKRQQQVTSELTEVKEYARAANARIADVSSDVTRVKSDVTNVKTEVTSTRSELQRTVSELKQITGDMGVMSGRIATNSKELAALKELGDRNYHSFKLARSKRPQRVGDIQVVLKKADPKRNRYSIDVMADDRKIEKKDKGLNEPVQFYVTSKARQPYEIVVNEIHPDGIVGYLATPKAPIARD